MKNRHTHNDTGIPLINIWIKIQFKNFHAKLKDSDGACHYNIGRKTHNRRLPPRLPQNILLTDTEESLSEWIQFNPPNNGSINKSLLDGGAWYKHGVPYQLV